MTDVFNPRLAHLLNHPKFARQIITGAGTPPSAGSAEPVEAWMKQRAVRDSLFLQANISRENGMAMGEVRVRNLSSAGLMAESKLALRVDDSIIVSLRGVGDVPGRVAWAKGNRIGIAFAHEIDPRMARKPVGNDPAKGIPFYVRYLGSSTQYRRS
jgi:hypothetical protein